MNEAQGLVVRAQVCITSLPPGSTGGQTRISWDPWQVISTSPAGTHGARLCDGSHPPATMFPMSGRYPSGTCVSGLIPFADQITPASQVDYMNEVGDRAEWRAS